MPCRNKFTGVALWPCLPFNNASADDSFPLPLAAYFHLHRIRRKLQFRRPPVAGDVPPVPAAPPQLLFPESPKAHDAG